jgi:hypothetical protein
MRTTLVVTVLALAPVLARGEEKKETKPADAPVTAKLVAKKDTYKLDLNGLSAEDFKKALKEGEKSGKTPPAPAVELALELTNTSDKEVKIWIGGDGTTLTLDLKGPGAVSVTPMRAFTQEYRIPMTVTLAPGKSQTLPITGLSYGHRGVATQAYWTEPGDYTLGASYATAISPAPPGSKDAGQGFGRVALTAAPVKIKVEK